MISGSTGYNYFGNYTGLQAGPKTFSLSSSFTGNSWVTLLGPIDVQNYPYLSITMINNHPTNNLQSGSVEFSPNGTQWETDWDITTFAGLTANGGIRSMQISGNSRKYLRLRGIPSGSGGTFTGSIDAMVIGTARQS